MSTPSAALKLGRVLLRVPVSLVLGLALLWAAAALRIDGPAVQRCQRAIGSDWNQQSLPRSTSPRCTGSR